MKKLQLKFLLTTLIIGSIIPLMARDFVHPGLSHKQSDLDRMRSMIESKIDPWYSSYVALTADSRAKYTYQVQGNKSITRIEQDGTEYRYFYSDAKAAYYNALLWGITQDERYAKKAVEIFNTWQNLTCFVGGGTESLNTGRVIWNFLEAAEIINSTYDGWEEEDIQKFKDMLVYPGYSTDGVPSSVNNNNGTFYWRMYNGDPGRHGNQDLFGWRGIMAMGVFLDNEIMYERALRYLRGEGHREDDIPYQSGPPITNSTIINANDASNEYYDEYRQQGYSNEIVDYGYNGVIEYFIWENGQCQESSRDQGHAVLGLGMLASIAEIAWNQGDDLYSFLDYRILKGYEWGLRYNMSHKYSYPDQVSSWEPTVENGEFIQRRDRSGRWFSKKVSPDGRGNIYWDVRPAYEIAYAHYKVREGLPDDSMKWLIRVMEVNKDTLNFETSSWNWTHDHLGWGGLNARRPEGCAGDPCIHVDKKPVFRLHRLPGAIQAEDYDHFASDGLGRTYYKVSPTNVPNDYRPESEVVLQAHGDSYKVTQMEDGDWLSYTVNIPKSSVYTIRVNYKAASVGGKLKISLGGADKSPEIEMPATGEDNWEDYTLAHQVYLSAGVQNLKIYVSGVSNILELNSISILPETVGAKSILLEVNFNSAVYELSWEVKNMIPNSYNIYRSDSPNFEDATLLANVFATAYSDSSVEEGNVYYYWIETTDGLDTVRSNYMDNGEKFEGYHDFNFTTGSQGWTPNTGNANLETSNGILRMAMALQDGGSYRGDLRYENFTVHTGNYPIFALKMIKPTTGTIQIDTNNGPYTNNGNNNNWAGELETDSHYTVYYYDFSEGNFVHPSNGPTTLPLDEAHTFTYFQFKIAGITDTTHYYIDWIKTFSSLEELEKFMETDSHSEFENPLGFDGSISLSLSYENESVLLQWEHEGFSEPNFVVYRNTEDEFETAHVLASGYKELTYRDSSFSDDMSIYYYWVQSVEEGEFVVSNSVSFDFSWGYLFDNFYEESIFSWRRASGESENLKVEIQDRMLRVTMVEDEINGGLKAPIYRSNLAYLHAGLRPIVAFKMDMPEQFNMAFGYEDGVYAGKNNAWTGTMDDKVYYYDLTKEGFVNGEETHLLPLDELSTIRRMSLDVNSVKSGETSFGIYWIRTFRNVEELREYLDNEPNWQGMENKEVANIQYYCFNNILYINDLPSKTSVYLYTLDGRLEQLSTVSSGNVELELGSKGIYIVKLVGNNVSESFKVFNK